VKALPPIVLRDKYWHDIEVSIKRQLDDDIYRPLAAACAVPFKEIQNAATSALSQAIVDGVIWYEGGYFRGEFNARTTAELRGIGAQFNYAMKAWQLDLVDMPPALSFAQAAADSRFNNMRKAFLHTLDDIENKAFDWYSATRDRYRESINWMDKDFYDAVSSIAIPPVLTSDQKQLIASEWGQNLELYVQKWRAQSITQMRQKVMANTFEGRRASALINMLRQSHGVSMRKAEFLARQETSLLLSKYKQSRAKDMGLPMYRWSTSHDERVRSDHRHLNGKTFLWSDPPVTNHKTGARNNPGEDFGCRCVAIMLVR